MKGTIPAVAERVKAISVGNARERSVRGAFPALAQVLIHDPPGELQRVQRMQLEHPEVAAPLGEGVERGREVRQSIGAKWMSFRSIR